MLGARDDRMWPDVSANVCRTGPRGWWPMRVPRPSLGFRVGCTWRDPVLAPQREVLDRAPPGFITYRRQMAQAGAALSFRVPLLADEDHPQRQRRQSSSGVRVLVRMGCIGTAATSGRYAAGALVTSSNPQMCGNRSEWWGFTGRRNVDGLLRELAGRSLAEECEALGAASGGVDADEQVKLLPRTARVTGAHALSAECLIHALAPSSYGAASAEHALRRTYGACFEAAGRRSLARVAVPALGCGVSGFPPHVSARAAFDALQQQLTMRHAREEGAPRSQHLREEGAPRSQHLREEGAPVAHGEDARGDAHGERDILREVEFWLNEEHTYAAFADAAYLRWGRGGG